ncbi:MAG: hypothetical protein Phog2KO_36630 [Phototrophicaceae bacterium]
MARQYPSELHIGQKVLVNFNAGAHTIEALVTKIDRQEGMVHVNPIGYKVRWAAKPRIIRNIAGQFLNFEDEEFSFRETRML